MHNVELGTYVYGFKLPHPTSTVKWNFKSKSQSSKGSNMIIDSKIRLGREDMIQEKNIN